jgi:hypothetical protein
MADSHPTLFGSCSVQLTNRQVAKRIAEAVYGFRQTAQPHALLSTGSSAAGRQVTLLQSRLAENYSDAWRDCTVAWKKLVSQTTPHFWHGTVVTS